MVAYASVNDVGRVVNPTIVVGQLDGGAVQGIGQALCEQVVYDREIRPAADRQLHGLRAAARRHGRRASRPSSTSRTPCLTNPLGVKGVGELGTIGATPAVVNAVVDALARAGAGERAPSDADAADCRERVWSALHGQTA